MVNTVVGFEVLAEGTGNVITGMALFVIGVLIGQVLVFKLV